MKKTILLVTVLSFLVAALKAQSNRYLVQLTDKGNSPYSFANPSAFLSQRAIERRIRYTIPIDSTDLPVMPGYTGQIAAVPGVTVLNVSKWLNQLSIQVTDQDALATINAFPFVRTVSVLGRRMRSGDDRWLYEEENNRLLGRSNARELHLAGNYFDYGTNSYNEIHLHNGEFLHNIGLRGETMQLAMLDGGYFNYTVYKAFDSINANGQVLDTWDFVARHPGVTEDNSHGMSCFSTIAANIPGQFIGTAPKAQFYLFRTEDVSSEYLIEEHNWVCGAERADSSGADVVSSSVGYSTFNDAGMNHTYGDLDGNTTIAARGADLAAKKGLLIFIAAGNEGNNTWHYIMTPADADSVVTVGAVNSNGVKGAFSSYGPTADGRIKPDIVSVGAPGMILSAANTIVSGPGTSYACPKIAGLVTCLWQAFPEVNNMRIADAVKKSGSTAANPSDSLGYGIPDMKLAFTLLLKEFVSTTASVENCKVILNWTSKDISAMKYVIERKAPGDLNFTSIGDISPQPGTILANHSYSFENSVAGINAGIISYRIKQVIDSTSNGFTEVYLDTLDITAAGCNNIPEPAAFKITAAPNPAVQDEIVLLIETPFAVPSLIITIHDSFGRLLRQQKESKNPGKATYRIPTRNFSRGKYIISVSDSHQRIGTTEVIKL